VQVCLFFALIIETLVLFIGILQANTCGPLTTTRGLTASIIVFSFAVLHLFFVFSSWILKQVRRCRERYGMHDDDEMLPQRIERTHGPSSRKMKFIENIYGLVMVS
jgi:hypothetical protein